jgi:3-hydroxyisobutyrate dehydrogenase-like beta-hydroxyacid dehydrogenase
MAWQVAANVTAHVRMAPRLQLAAKQDRRIHHTERQRRNRSRWTSVLDLPVEVFLGTNGLLAGCRAGMIHVDSTTADPASTRRLAAEYAARGAAMVDAPMGRTPKEAEAGKLNTFIGGDPAALDRVRPTIACYVDSTVDAYPIGSWHTLKLVNTFISVGTSAAIAEAVATAAKLGVDLNNLYEVVSSGGANSAMFQMMMPWVMEGDDSKLKGPLRIAGKDLRFYCRMAEATTAPAFIAQAASQTYQLANARGNGERFIPTLPGILAELTAQRFGSCHNGKCGEGGVATRRHVVGHDGIRILHAGLVWRVGGGRSGFCVPRHGA